MSILNHFPFGTPRQGQIEALNFIEESVFAGYRDIVIEAPTGVGKSGIGVCANYWLANEVDPMADSYGTWENKGYYLVTQKLLQAQLETDIKRYKEGCHDGVSIKSAIDYPCPLHGNCAAGARKKDGCPNRNSLTCAYVVQRNRFIDAQLGVTNYSYFFSAKEYTDKLARRAVLILDECHNLEDQIIRYNEGTVSTADIERFSLELTMPDFDFAADYMDWLGTQYAPRLNEVVMALSDISDDSKSQELVDADQHMCKINRTLNLYKNNIGRWIFWQETKADAEDERKLIKTSYMRALTGAPFYERMICSIAPIRLHFSAYPGPKDVYCANLGLKPSTVAWLKLPSTFSPKNRQIIAYNLGSLSKAKREESMPDFLKFTSAVLNKKKERGIIHCGTYDIGHGIMKYFRDTEFNQRLIFPKNADERDKACEQHALSDDGVLISPSMAEGYDFKDDLARWQIIFKVPFLYLGDKQIAARAKIDERWYKMRAVMLIVQASGRICRSETDYGVTYILDSDFDNLYNRCKDMFPQWWRDALVIK